MPERLAEAAFRARRVSHRTAGLAHAELVERFRADESVEILVHARAELIDVILREVWRSQLPAGYESWALAAVGGYGRGELHPHSDVDILILVPGARRTTPAAAWSNAWSRSSGTSISKSGHSVRTVAECAEESAADVGVMTTLIEARLLAGNATLFGEMREAVSADRIWPVNAYFEAKVAEQQDRHLKANDTAYNLEPNVKTGPGGLRDIQTIAWVAKRHFGASSLDELLTHGFLSSTELRKLKQAQSFLWKVRFGLHVLTGRREDRLLFDHQIKLAQSFGYEDASYTLAVEQFMQRYYRTVMDVMLLNELLLQLFREAILTETAPPRPLNPRFQVRNDYLEAVNEELFARTPSTLLELFVVLQQNPEVKGVRASTIRAVNKNLWLIDEEFRQNPRNHRLFLEILRAPAGVTHELRRMNTYGVLGRYIPAFGRIVGRMQYDLFHAYTVDAHTLFVVSNLRRLSLPKYDHELPQLSAHHAAAAEARDRLPRRAVPRHRQGPRRRSLAAGRGGRRSVLPRTGPVALRRAPGRLAGAEPPGAVGDGAEAGHLRSRSRQRLRAQVGDETHLDYLYVLTSADVRGTNPKLWNSWKASLFQEFYERVKRALRRGLESPIDPDELMRETQDGARKLLAAAGRITAPEITRAWERLTAGLFPAAHARGSRLAHAAARRSRARQRRPAGRGAVEQRARHHRHPRVRAASLQQLRHHHRGARPARAQHRRRADHADRRRLQPRSLPRARRRRRADRRQRTHRRNRTRAVARAAAPRGSAGHRHAARAAPGAHVPHRRRRSRSRVDERNRRSVLELVAGDRPGLLCDVGKVLMEERVDLLAAKIMTVGERAEDVFYLASLSGAPLDEAAATRLQQKLSGALDRRAAA